MRGARMAGVTSVWLFAGIFFVLVIALFIFMARP
jgi:hypothetical protein